MSGALYDLKDVWYSYHGRVPALSGVNFSVKKGETVALLGSNGSGKSTLLKILNALIFPDKGEVIFAGKPLCKDCSTTEFRSRVGFVFHDPDTQLFSPTVYDELSFGPLQLGIGEAEARRRVEDTILLLGLEAVSLRAPYELSAGEKKKVAIASILTVNPDVILMDEPTNGLDPRTQVWFIELILKLGKAGKTFVIATHDLSLAADVADRAVILDEAHCISADGPAGAVLKDRNLLLKANLMHEHPHRHGDVTHTHSHGPFAVHDEHE